MSTPYSMDEENFIALVEGVIQHSEYDKGWSLFDSSAVILVLVRGELAGNLQWAYVLMKPRGFLKFKLAEMRGSYNLADYGEIVARGSGLVPCDDTVRIMSQRYGARQDAEAILTNAFDVIWSDMKV